MTRPPAQQFFPAREWGCIPQADLAVPRFDDELMAGYGISGSRADIGAAPFGQAASREGKNQKRIVLSSCTWYEGWRSSAFQKKLAKRGAG